MDVTRLIIDVAREDRTVRVDGDLFRMDPDPGRVKTLRIVARGPDGAIKSYSYQENSIFDGATYSERAGNGGGGHDSQGGSALGGNPRDSDDGDYRILSARYGTTERAVDVTERLKELARQDVRFKMGNDTFGVDPVPGQVKILRIVARGRDGRTRNFDYREGSVVDGSRFTGWGSGNWNGNGNGNRGRGRSENPGPSRAALVISKATYGARNRSSDVTGRLQSMVSNNRLDIRVDNDTMGTDPAPGVPKTLWITYDGGARGHRSQQMQVAEGNRLSLP